MSRFTKALSCLILLTMMFALFPVFASAASISLLSGKVIQAGSSLTNPLGTTTRVTDGSLETGYTLQPGVSNSSIIDQLYYTFATDQVVDSFRLEMENYSNQSFQIVFMNSSNEYIYSSYLSTLTGENGVYRLPTRITGVKLAYLYNSHTSAQTVLEWDLYRDEIPSAPFNLEAVAGNQSVTLSWDAVPDANTYTLKRSQTVGGPYQVIADNLSSTIFTDASVTNGVTYYYVVVANNNEGQSIDSNEATATPQVPNNSEPTNDRALLTIYISGGQIKEYDLSPAELSAFLNWYDAKDAGSGPAKYAFTKTWNKGPFKTRTEYVIFDKILTFDVDEYEVANP